MSQPWRLIPPMVAPGALHMAIDGWLLDQHLHHGHPPTLRFYTWDPPAISLGFSQRRNLPDHWSTLTWQGQPIDLVQRPTGGRGVLHQGDLTYALITSGWDGTREQVYRHLCQFLIQGWGQLGLPLELGSATRPDLSSANCFGLSTAADLVTPTGLKWIGSAQLRRGQAILQHGSMRLNPDPDLYEQVFQTPAPRVDAGIVLPPQSSIIDALVQAATRSFGCTFVTQPLSAKELVSIQSRSHDHPTKAKIGEQNWR
ncbi:biotin--protein ligase [Leptolyngbya sp. BL0902]|uniref:lipoate--protein ligase family protein n=1 Tax=Leptolyngbya sp. BL0902 TaxID=1115757 RepID=UPI001934EAEE|nr:biotin/lipoate A/B protein ligase family protein [Leptolyngbya sp. BL0902]QQE65009.1 biotin--protein ligase [Leptolyngbya sp. BL0902]